MTAQERDRFVIRSLVYAAPFVTVLAGGLVLGTWWKSISLSVDTVLSASAIGGGLLWFSYESWKRHRGYAYLLPLLFVGWQIWEFCHAASMRRGLVVHESALAVLMYFLPLWLLTPRLRAQEFLPRFHLQVSRSLHYWSKLKLINCSCGGWSPLRWASLRSLAEGFFTPCSKGRRFP